MRTAVWLVAGLIATSVLFMGYGNAVAAERVENMQELQSTTPTLSTQIDPNDLLVTDEDGSQFVWDDRSSFWMPIATRSVCNGPWFWRQCGPWYAQYYRNDSIVREVYYANSYDQYSERSNIPRWGGECKEFVQEVLRRTSGGCAELPKGTYDYTRKYPHRLEGDVIRNALPGEVIQFTGAHQHTAVIVHNFHDGRFGVIDSNWISHYRIGWHTIDTTSGSLERATMRSYVITH